MSSRCFAPIEDEQARVLILGSLPGVLSLARQEYYAHPRNSFWRIMERFTGVAATGPYSERTLALVRSRIAVWDVCAAAERSGSLDSSIRSLSVVVNDFANFLGTHTGIGLICFNGKAAEELYRRRVLPSLPRDAQKIRRASLPSSSPAHAIPFAEKLSAWQAALNPVVGSGEPQDADSLRE
jgi:TDG/mug DNA glycosylase family protein